ncbi:MAG: SsrA-binding protein [Alphaproteobacteria bacterium]|nr:SsrA-binding protein [Alphaproteobacteria bacterium]|tara:strand:- start:569 stop:1042 length:474 start_codon:yes stop_codon:yes gene_type:complete
MARSAGEGGRTVAVNRKARRNYFIDETFEAGIVLQGSEVKSMRAGRGSINEAYATERKGEIYLINAHIPEYAPANRQNHEPRRPRKLLLHKREIKRLFGAIQREGMTLVPLSLYFNEKGRAKVELGLAHGKRKYDKRAAERDRDWSRQKARIMRDRG